MTAQSTTAGVTALRVRKETNLWVDAFGRLIRNRAAVVGGLIVICLILTAIFAPLLAPRDYASQVFLQWLIKEQVEEEKNAIQILETLKMAGDKGNSLVMLDQKLASR